MSHSGKAILRSSGRIQLRNDMSAWLLLLPTLIFMLTFSIYPIMRSIYLSFFRLELGMRTPELIGLGNYQYLFKNYLFKKVMRNTGISVLLTVIPTMVIGLLFALAVNRRSRMIGLLRTAFFYPVVMPMIAAACVWKFFYMPQLGLISKTLSIFGIREQNFLSNRSLVIPALAVVYIWKDSGYLMVFWLSGLQGIDQQLYEAAEIDGASSARTFCSITLPLLMPTFLFVSTMALTNSLKLVDHIMVMTEGAPSNGSTTLLYYIYLNAFNNFDQGIASTLTTIMLIIMVAVTMLQYLSTDNRIHYN